MSEVLCSLFSSNMFVLLIHHFLKNHVKTKRFCIRLMLFLCFIQAVKPKDVIRLISGFTLSSLSGYYSGNSGKVSGHVKLLGWVLSMAQPVSFKEGTISYTDAEQTSILEESI